TINKAIGGWQNSDLIIVAGRPGMGKTAFMVQQIVDAVKQNIPTGVFSLEMSAEQITGRVITNYTGIPNSSILRKGLKYDEIEKF
ncbi:DnaB-like helicase C-terminal domain-containing protein, partial [Elizabethkingia meningoseptica]